MNHSNPIKLVKKLTFKSSNLKSLGLNSDYPEYLRISPNGQYLALGTDDNVYVFDLKKPMLSWQDSLIISNINRVCPTDKGNYWVSENKSIQLLNKHHKCILDLQVGYFSNMWGNDDWFLIHNEKSIQYANTFNLNIMSITHKDMILHAWRLKESIMFISISKNKKYLSLYNWQYNESKIEQIDKIKYNYDFGISGIAASYMFTHHIHAWPLENGDIIIKLMPWAVIVSADGKITLSDDYIAFHSIAHSSGTGLSKQDLAKITVCSLDSGLSPSTCSSPTPFIITTIEHEDYVHIISSLWHKKILSRDLKHITDDHLNENVNDIDVAALLIANSVDQIPPLENMISTVFEMFEKKSFEPLLKKHHNQIVKLFGSTFIKSLSAVDVDFTDHECRDLDGMFDFLKILFHHQHLLAPFFISLNNKELSQVKRDAIIKLLQILVPILPKKLLSIIPSEIIDSAQNLMQIIDGSPIGIVEFLLKRAPTSFFNVEHSIILINKFNNEIDALEITFKKMMKNKGTVRDIINQKHSKIYQTLKKELSTPEQVNWRLLPLMLKYGIVIPKEMNSPLIMRAYLIQNKKLSISKLAVLLAKQPEIIDEDYPPELSELLLFSVENHRFLPSFLQTMIKLSYISKRTDLNVIFNDVSENDCFIIESLWKQSEGLDVESKWAFAVTLFLVQERFIGRLPTKKDTSNKSKLIMTMEATLLQKITSKKTSAFKEMLACIDSDFGMSEVHKDVSLKVMEFFHKNKPSI